MKIKLARAGLACLALLAALELALQGGHALSKRRTGPPDPDAPVILCLGDSHTYGAGVAEDATYPWQLESMLRSRGSMVRVVNMGAPGMNTSQIRRELPGLLERYEPVAVIVLAGVNNGWNRMDQAWSDVQDGIEVSWSRRALDFLTTRVRTVRAAYVILHRLEWAGERREVARNRDGSFVLHRRKESWTVEELEDTYQRARRDLMHIVAMARAAHATPVLMTYVSDPEYDFTTPNRLLREVAASMKVPLADNDLAIRPMFDKEEGMDRETRDKLFMQDMHPTREGYKEIAGNVMKTLDTAGAPFDLPGSKGD